MKKFWKNNPYLKVALYSLFVIILSILFYRISSNTDNIAPSIIGFVKNVVHIISPILYGFLMAYLFNPIMDFFEHYLLMWFKPSSKNQRQSIRSFSILIVYLCIGGTIVLMFRFLIPQILNNIRELGNMLPAYMEEFKRMVLSLQQTIANYLPGISLDPMISNLFDRMSPEKLFNFSAINNVVSSIMSQTVTIASNLFNYIMGIVIAFYVLSQKETIAYTSKRIIYSALNKKLANKIIAICAEGHDIFNQFFIGKFIDSLIIGTIAFIGLYLMHNPYALLLALIIGITNMIPYFGPIIGAVPAVIITLFEGLTPALGVLIFTICLQQFDGLVLGPKILGNSIGLSPFWIITGILIGGALWGPLGMFFASPIVAVILNNINRSIDRKLTAKEIALEESIKPIPKPKGMNWFK